MSKKLLNHNIPEEKLLSLVGLISLLLPDKDKFANCKKQSKWDLWREKSILGKPFDDWHSGQEKLENHSRITHLYFEFLGKRESSKEYL